MKISYLLLISALVFVNNGFTQRISFSSQAKPTLVAETNNPMEVETITLSNGLTVYLNRDSHINSVLGAVVVKGGSKNDPSDATGIAHYLEHMLFKGTKSIGTTDYKSEKVWLDSVAFMFSMLPYTEGDDEYRKKVYKKIDYYSQQAARFAIPGEFDKLVSLMGGKGLNAFTDFEKIVYYNQFPSENLSLWLELYKERFENAVFRLFQTEIETVFEEKNMSQDNMFVRVYENLYSHFYPTTSYGSRTVLGSIEHLKNPSVYKMESYYKEFYVANNMALILVGNFDINTTVDEINRIFGTYRIGNPKELKQESEPALKGKVVVNERLTPIPIGIIGYRVPGLYSSDKPVLDVFMKMLNNEQGTGILDSLAKNKKLLYSMAVTDYHTDMGGLFIGFAPRIPFQSLNQGEKLIQKALDQIKSGNFSDEYFESVKKALLLERQLQMENPGLRMKMMAEVFVSGKSWNDEMQQIKEIQQLNRTEFLEILKKYIAADYMFYKSKMGSANKTFLKKPSLTPFKPKESKSSDYYQDFNQKIITVIQPRIITQGVDYEYSELQPGIKFYYVKNPYNSIFTYRLVYLIGENELPGAELVANYLSNVGLPNLEYSQFKHELQKMGTDITFMATESYFVVTMSGFDEHFMSSLKLLNELLQTPENDKSALKLNVRDRRIENRMIKADKNALASVLNQYILYGQNSSYIKRLSISDIRKMNYEDVSQILNKITKCKTNISYAGRIESKLVMEFIRKHQILPTNPRNTNSPIDLPIIFSDSNQVYCLNSKKSVQSAISITIPSVPLNFQQRMLAKPYNTYFGSGLNSVIFREIREYRALAYTAYGNYYLPMRFSNPGYFFGYTSTQTDKTIDALTVFNQLIDSLSLDSDAEYVVKSLKNSFNLDVPSFRNLAYYISSFQFQGFESDPRAQVYAFYQYMKPEELLSFHNQYVSGRSRSIGIVGKISDIPLNQLESFGTIRNLKLKMILTK